MTFLRPPFPLAIAFPFPFPEHHNKCLFRLSYFHRIEPMHSVLNVKVLVGTFNQEKAFSMSVKLRQHQFSSSSVEGRRKGWCWCVAIYRAVTGHRVLAQRDTGPCPPSPHLSSPHLTHRKHRHMCCVDIHQAKQKQQ